MTNEEAIETLLVIQKYYNDNDIDGYVGFDEVDNKALDMAIKALEQEPKWIPVSEKLPEEMYAVLVWCPERKNTYCAYLEEGQWWIFGAYFAKVELEVTAWMPLPEPHKAESEDAE